MPPDPSPTLSLVERAAWQQYALRLAPSTASVANFCDHAEHNESLDRDWVLGPAEALRLLALEIADAAGISLIELYAERLGEIEARNILARPGGYDGHRAVLEADSWRALQLVQAE